MYVCMVMYAGMHVNMFVCVYMRMYVCMCDMCACIYELCKHVCMSVLCICNNVNIYVCERDSETVRQ